MSVRPPSRRNFSFAHTRIHAETFLPPRRPILVSSTAAPQYSMQQHFPAQCARAVASKTAVADGGRSHSSLPSAVLSVRLPTAGPAHRAYAAALQQQRVTRMLERLAGHN